MSFVQYLKDKRFFIAFYFVLMSFISLLMLVSVDRQGAYDNIIYANVGCLIFAGLYLVIGYYYRNPFYRGLDELIHQKEFSELVPALPESQTYGQAKYVEFLEKLQKEHGNQLQSMEDERRDHQDFVLSWIHEVKLPIAAGRLLIQNSQGKTVEFLMDKLEDEINKIDNYVEQALYYSRIDSFSKDYFITEVHLNGLIKESIKKHAKMFIARRISVHLDETLTDAYSDSKWLKYIVDQIVSNSLKYTNEGGKITFEFEEDSQEKRLRIHDTGIGIPPEDLSRVFDKGFTGAVGRSNMKSTGIGLYLANQLAIKLGHKLSIQSNQGRSTTVTIHFPKIRNYYHV